MDHIIAVVVTVGVAALLLFGTVLGTGNDKVQGQLSNISGKAVTDLSTLAAGM